MKGGANRLQVSYKRAPHVGGNLDSERAQVYREQNSVQTTENVFGGKVPLDP